jgi:hypothetical protein
MSIRKEHLLSYGFVEECVTPEESGQETPYYYYTYSIGDERSILITNASDEREVGDDGYHVEFFDHPEIGKIRDLGNLLALINIFNFMQKHE